MKKREKKRLVLIGISRKGEKGFKTLIRAYPENNSSVIDPPHHLYKPSPDKLNKYLNNQSHERHMVKF